MIELAKQLHRFNVIARKRREKNSRSAFLSFLMKHISGDNGDSLSKAFQSGDCDKFCTKIDALASNLKNKYKEMHPPKE